MFRTVRNLIVSIMAAFIRDREARHKFRNKYKRKSKFRKLRDDNRILFDKIERLLSEVQRLRAEQATLKQNYDKHLREWEWEKSLIFRVAPLDNSPPKGPVSNVFLAIVCIAKNEAPYLKEWIEYHKIVGVERFYFYDNESDDNTKEILEPYIKDGTVVYHLLPNHPITGQRQQIEAYNDAIYKYRDRTRWLAIIDADEFIVPVEKDSIPEFLEDYDQYPGVVANWICFDSNGHDRRPAAHGGLLTANYTRARKDNNATWRERLVKSIVNPKQIVNFISEHEGLYYHNIEAVTENFEKTRGDSTKYNSTSKIRINHYYTKSREEYLSKVTRNLKGAQTPYKFDENMLNFPEETAEDLVIQKYVPHLKDVLGIKD